MTIAINMKRIMITITTTVTGMDTKKYHITIPMVAAATTTPKKNMPLLWPFLELGLLI